MATKKDLVEAYSFSRRRLVTAFVSGAPGGREVEPAKPGRTIVGGLALAILLVAGGAVAGVFSSRVEVDWDEPGLITDKDSRAAYVILDDIPGLDEPKLRPVVNITSARLILGPDAEAKEVPSEEIDKETRGSPIGIVGAPATPPDADDLVTTDWTACTGPELGLMFNVSETPELDVTASPDPQEVGFVVRSGGDLYLIAEATGTSGDPARAYSYQLPKGSQLSSQVGAGIASEAVDVPADWLTLFPAGGALDEESLGLDGAGTPPSYAAEAGLDRKARIGDYYEDPSGILVLTEDGPTQFDPFALVVLQQIVFDGRYQAKEIDRPASPPPLASAPYELARWPDRELDPSVPDGEMCAVLRQEPGKVPGVRLAETPTGGSSAKEQAVEEGEREVTVDPGHGAYVLSGSWDDPEQGEPFLIDDLGLSFPMVGPNVPGNLGYGGVEPAVVNDSWVELFSEGVELSVERALCPPDVKGQQKCD